MKKLSLALLSGLCLIVLCVESLKADPALPLPRMPICGDQDDPNDPPIFHCADLVPISEVQIFQVPGSVPLTITIDFVYRQATFNNELGYFIVDDASGTVAGIAPGETGYLAAALGQASILFPSGSNAYTPDIDLNLNGGDFLLFFIIQNDTLSNFLLNNPSNDINGQPLAFFSLDILNPDEADHFVGFESVSSVNTQFGFEDMTNGGDIDYDDVVYNIIPPIDPVCSEDKWFAKYYQNRDLIGPPVQLSCEDKIDFYWGEESPSALVPIDNFSARWTRTLDLTEAGWYRFRTFTDDGLRLYIDGELIIDDWSPQAFHEKDALKELTAGPHTVVMEYVEWSHEAMAHLSLYKCREGAQDCSIDLTPLYQTNFPSHPLPATCSSAPAKPGGGYWDQTISGLGCAITSVSMALQNHGIYTTPAGLNDWLSVVITDTNSPRYGKPRGYSDLCTGNLLWAQIENFADKASDGAVDITWQSVTTIDTLESVIRNEQQPVVMQVDSGGHYILAYEIIRDIDQNKDTLGIYDPHHAWTCWSELTTVTPPSSDINCTVRTDKSLRHATTTLEESTYRGNSFAYGYLETDTGTRAPSLQISSVGVEILLANSTGQRTGFLKDTGQLLFEIPNSFYFNTEIVSPGSTPTQLLRRTLFLPEDASSHYLLKLIGEDPPTSPPINEAVATDFEIMITGFDSQFFPAETMVTGAIEPGEEIIYLILHKPGQAVEIVRLDYTTYLPNIVR